MTGGAITTPGGVWTDIEENQGAADGDSMPGMGNLEVCRGGGCIGLGCGRGSKERNKKVPWVETPAVACRSCPVSTTNDGECPFPHSLE